MKTTFIKKTVGVLLCAALLIGCLPLGVLAASEQGGNIFGAQFITDASGANSWKSVMGSGVDGNRYAGRVWADKSVYANGDTVVLSGKDAQDTTFTVSLQPDEAFQVIFSVLGSTMSTVNTVTSTNPMDVVLVLDNSVSMNTETSRVTRMQRVIEAANGLLADLLDNHDVRLGIVSYAQDAATVLPFGTYENGVVLDVNRYSGSGSTSGVITALDKDGQTINRNYKSDGYANYTNTQAGFDLAMEMLQNADNTAKRKPVVILLTDGAANTATDTLFHFGSTGTDRQVYHASDIDPMIALSTLLGAAYNKAAVERHYGQAPLVYGIGVDLSSRDGSNAIIDPAANFNANNSNANIRRAYEVYTENWLKGDNVSIQSGGGFMSSGYTFRFGHQYPADSGVTDALVAANIHYVDNYFPVSSEQMQTVFEQIYEELVLEVFNPITDTSTLEGATGVRDTPLIFVDYIHRFMQIKDMQKITLFGESYDIVEQQDGSYTLAAANGTNPTTGEKWDLADDVVITVTPQQDGTDKLEIRIYQEILPIIMEKVVAQTVGDVTTATLTEVLQDPLRVYYTVGLRDGLLLPDGSVDLSKLRDYEHVDGDEVTFYLNQFGVVNAADADGTVTKGDSHIGFKPSPENRFYYHQTNQGVFTKIIDKQSGDEVDIPASNEYGILWDEQLYRVVGMTYEEYCNAQDDDKIYTHVTYYRPIEAGGEAAQQVTYLVYTEWRYLKESITFYDVTAQAFLNDGKAIDVDGVQQAVQQYLQSHPDAELYAVLGVGSLRTSRLHNMIVEKEQNPTDTATQLYTPEYTYETAQQHHGNDVVIWLGSNGAMTVKAQTGILLQKQVTEDIGHADDTYALTVTLPAGVTATPRVVGSQGEAVGNTYNNNVLTVYLKAGQSAYVSGIPAGTVCAIGEIITGDYHIASQTEAVVIPAVDAVLDGAQQFVAATVVNAPNEYGKLAITKTIVSDHTVPESIADATFEVTVQLGEAFAEQAVSVIGGEGGQPYQVTADAQGELTLRIKDGQTIELINLPAGLQVTVTEKDPAAYFAVSYSADNTVVIPAGEQAAVQIINRYLPVAAAVELDIVGTKSLIAQGEHLGGRFVFKVQVRNGSEWQDVDGKSAEAVFAQNEDGSQSFVIEKVMDGITYTAAGSHLYRVLEVQGEDESILYDGAQYTFEVIVTDDAGHLQAQVVGAENGAYQVVFYNYTVDAVLTKDVYADTDESINGEKVAAGDELVYSISFTNVSHQPADLTITDRIPAYTTYVEGSADNGGVYADGALVWTFEQVPARGTVTVSFRVTVDADVQRVTVRNTAEGTDGQRTYQSNEVSNYTEVTQPDPIIPDNPTTGHNGGVRTVATVLWLSAGALTVSLVCGKKKKQAEA